MKEKGRITIIVVELDTGDFGVEVTVSGTLSTAESVGFMELGKLQHVESKRSGPVTAYQVETPNADTNGDPWSDMYVTPKTEVDN